MNFQQIVTEALDTSIYMQGAQKAKKRDIEFLNVYNKFMIESYNKTLQGFEAWFKNQESTDVHNVSYDELYQFVAQKIGSDPRAYAVEA